MAEHSFLSPFRVKRKALRQRILGIYGDKCSVCGRTARGPVLHHRRFDGVKEREQLGGKEEDRAFVRTYRDAIMHPDKEKFEVMCNVCHSRLHNPKQKRHPHRVVATGTSGKGRGGIQ